MIALETSTYGVMDTLARQHEYLLVCSALDCVCRERGDWIADVMTWFKSDWIVDKEFQTLFRCLIQMGLSDTPHDEYGVLTALPLERGASLPPVAARLCGLWMDKCNQSAHLRYYAKQVYAEYRRVAVSCELTGLSTAMLDANDPDDVMGDVEDLVRKYAPAAIERSECNEQVIDDLIDELDGKRHVPWFDLGIPSLDQMVGGVPPSSLLTVGARSSGGKSAFLGQVAMKCVLVDQKPVMFFSHEMSQQELYRRWAAWLAEQPYRTGLRKEVGVALLRVKDLVKRGLLNVFAGARTVERIEAEVMAYTASHTVGLIVVDYVQAVTPTKSRSEGREQQVAHIAGSLKRIAMQTGVIVLTGTQLNKDGEEKPRGSTVRESEAILNYSNILLLLHSKHSEADNSEMTVIVEKNRDYRKGSVEVLWRKPIFRIQDRDEPHWGPVESIPLSEFT